MHVEGRAPHLGNLASIDAVESASTTRRPQLPPVVGERAYNGSQLGGVRIQSAVGHVDRHVARKNSALR
jgi:hypothetical protein